MGPTWQDWVCCAVLYVARMYGVSLGYHRYFSHRAFKTGRVMQFFLAILAQSTTQRGALWWAAGHRNHHRYSDTERDVHSPKQWGFWYSHLNWIYDGTRRTDYDKVKDFVKYPELVILNKLWYLPAIIMGTVVYFLLGWTGLLVGFFFSTVLVCHATFAINSVAHVWGSRRFETTDTSRNHWLPAVLLLGEGWHNNHHHYQSSARSGFYWWEIDVAYYTLWLLARLGLVWDLRPVPAHVYEAAAVETDPVRPAL
jgi:stearoyl-CoA desaturase (delta-9 desaturase)